MSEKELIKETKEKMNPAFNKLKSVAKSLTQSGNHLSITVIEAIADIESVLYNAHIKAKD